MEHIALPTVNLRPTARQRVWALLVLVAVAHFFFFGQPVGLSLALYAVLVGATLCWLTGHRDFGSIAALVLACLPVVEDLNPLSAAILTLGVIAFALRAHFGSTLGWAQIPMATLGFAGAAPLQAARDMPDAFRFAAKHLPTRSSHLRHNWAMPLVLGICFAILLTMANPVLQAHIERLFTINPDQGNASRHVAFCLAMAVAIWPFLVRPGESIVAERALIDPGRLGINGTSLRHALILFNALFAVQTVLDLTYLWAGTTLPEGMTPATYAHRGAYPLLATALLAGAFTLVSRPFAQGALRNLLLIWIAQNVLLVVSALYRLDLYVDAFGLTYLRISAAIWMALVAIGLCLTAWQIIHRHSNAWLLWRCAVLGLGTVYICAFINFAHIIAVVNLKRPFLDTDYLCDLGPHAAAAVRAQDRPPVPWCWQDVAGVQGWRDWGFRTVRVMNLLEDAP